MATTVGAKADGERAVHALDAVRVRVALLIFIHGATRISIGRVVPFGGRFDQQGFEFGHGQAGV